MRVQSQDPIVLRNRMRTKNLRRWCIKCGIKEGFYLPGDLIYNRLGEKLWICSCRQTREKGEDCRVCGDHPSFRGKGDGDEDFHVVVKRERGF